MNELPENIKRSIAASDQEIGLLTIDRDHEKTLRLSCESALSDREQEINKLKTEIKNLLFTIANPISDNPLPQGGLRDMVNEIKELKRKAQKLPDDSVFDYETCKEANDAYRNEISELKSPHYQMAFKRVEELKSENERLKEALKNLSFMTQTSGGTAGKDEKLMKAIGEAELLLTPKQP